MATSHELKSAVDAIMADERGTIRKEAPWRMGLLYPSPYRAGMSSLGYQLIYREVCERRDWTAERCFLPDDPEAYRASRTPLFTFEGGRPLSECQVIGVSFAYELEVSGLLDCLDLSDIPLRGADRDGRHPLVVIGGPITFSNPLPIAPFADIVIMGEGEECIHHVLDLVEDASSRDELLVRASVVPGLYVPSIHGERLLPVVAVDNARLPAVGQIRTPHTELANMHMVEAERGCHRKCTYCVMRRSTNGGMRLADPDRILSSIPDDAERVGLVGAAVSDHPKLIPIVRGVIDSGRSIGMSSLRADRLSDELVQLLAAGGYRTLTVSSDGASERLRVQLQKAIRERHLFQAAEYAAKYKIRVLKVYMMVGVPGENEEDIDEMIRMCTELARINRVALGIAPFVAKRNTPLDRTAFAGLKPVEHTLKRIQRGLRGRVDVRSTSSRWAWVEYCMAQGGFDMADAAEAAWRGGSSFAAWKRAIKEHRLAFQPVDVDLRLGYPSGRFATEGHDADGRSEPESSVTRGS